MNICLSLFWVALADQKRITTETALEWVNQYIQCRIPKKEFAVRQLEKMQNEIYFNFAFRNY